MLSTLLQYNKRLNNSRKWQHFGVKTPPIIIKKQQVQFEDIIFVKIETIDINCWSLILSCYVNEWVSYHVFIKACYQSKLSITPLVRSSKILLPPTYSGESKFRVDCLDKLVIILGLPPSIDKDRIWSIASSSTMWKLPSLIVSTLQNKH